MALKVLSALCLLQTLAVQGLEPETVFVRRGGDLRLAGPGALSLREAQLFWKYNRTTNMLRFPSPGDPVFSQYRGRAEFIEESYSLLVKRVNHSDSGDYTAVVFGDRERDVAKYRVQVLDPVSPVQLRVETISLSEDGTDLTVTCGPIASNFTCNCTSFSQDEAPQEVIHSGSTYRIYHENSNIICNHSNQVSWTNDTMQILNFCHPTSAAPIKWTAVLLWVQFVFVFVGVCLVAGVSCRGRRLKPPAGLPSERTPDQPQPLPAEETVYELDD